MMPNEFDPAPQTTMLEDILKTDFQELSPQEMIPVTSSLDKELDKEGFHPLNLNHLNAGDWSVIVGALMKRHGISEMTLRESELRGLDAPEGLVTVLCASINPESTDVKLILAQAPKSEFRT